MHLARAMAAARFEVREEWRRFCDDRPGERFRNHCKRMEVRSRRHAAVAVALGVLLLATGVILLFMPGPGILVILFGVGLIASHSARLSAALDRAEPKLRQRGRRIEHRWHRFSHKQKTALAGGGLVLMTAGLAAMWNWIVAAYLL